jgi:hypothetical protein
MLRLVSFGGIISAPRSAYPNICHLEAQVLIRICMQVLWANKHTFRQALEGYAGKGLNSHGYARMLFALDEYRIGGVSPAVLDRQVEAVGGLGKYLAMFQAHGGSYYGRWVGCPWI